MAQKFTVQNLIAIFKATEGTTARAIRDRAMMMVLYGSGPRVEEIASLDVADFIKRDDGGYVLHYRKTKGGKSRYVGIKPAPANAIMSWLAIRPKYAKPKEESLFVALPKEARNSVAEEGRRGMDFQSAPGGGAEHVFPAPECPKGRIPFKGTILPPATYPRLSKIGFNRTLKKHAAAAGIAGGVRVFVHKMRATFATDLYDEGHGLKEISIVLGHSSVAITERYVSISEKILKQTMLSAARWKEVLGGSAE